MPVPAPTPKKNLFASVEKRTTIVGLLLVVITLAVYNPVVSHPFVNYDDDRYVTANPHVRQGLSGDTFGWALTSTDQANWHPLTWLSHALDYQLFRLNPAGHHFTSVVIHAVNAVLLFLLLMWATGQFGPSAFVALVFALHPINVESVAWVAERKNVLCTFFFLLTLWAYGWYAKKPDWQRYLAVVGLFVCALASKPMVITLPFVLFLVDYWPLGRIQAWTASVAPRNVPQKSTTSLVLEKIPLITLSAASAVITLVAQQSGGAMRSTQQFSLGTRLANAVHAYAMYLWMTIWPAKLAPLYPHPGTSLSIFQIALSAIVLVGITAAIWRARSHHYLLTGWLWFLGTLVPVVGLVQVGDQAMADRYAYIPLIGLFVMIAFGIAAVIAPKPSATAAPATQTTRASFPVIVAVTAVCVVSALAFTTRRQLSYWQTNESLWRHALAVTEHNFIAQDNLGGALLDQGKTEEASMHFYAAAAINPRDPMSRGNIGAYLLEQRQFAAAIDELTKVEALTSDTGLRASAYANLGTAYRESGDLVKSRQNYDESLRLNPAQANAWLGLGLLEDEEGNPQKAAFDSERAAELQPSPQAFFQLARSLVKLGRRPEARISLENALKLQPDFADAQKALDSLGPD